VHSVRPTDVGLCVFELLHQWQLNHDNLSIGAHFALTGRDLYFGGLFNLLETDAVWCVSDPFGYYQVGLLDPKLIDA
jgi:hypothetical protein